MAKPPKPHPILETARLRLRQFRLDDAAAMHACYGDPAAMRHWDHPVHTRMIETERAVRNSIECTPSYYRVWAVADAATDHCIGMVNYHDGHLRSRQATIGYILEPARQRQGLAGEAVLALQRYCFGPLGLHRLQALIHPDNHRSRALVERLGFRCEGLLRDNMRVGDVWHDNVLYALLATDPQVPDGQSEGATP
jgi:RimJ/RimL family protein N-acetyltransferase